LIRYGKKSFVKTSRKNRVQDPFTVWHGAIKGETTTSMTYVPPCAVQGVLNKGDDDDEPFG
jgi:hypothetical protein